MRTPDWMSKKRQKLHEELHVWRQKLRGIGRAGVLSPEQITMCKVEIEARTKALLNLRTGTRAQRKAGFANS